LLNKILQFSAALGATKFIIIANKNLVTFVNLNVQKTHLSHSCGLYYKHMTIANADSSIISEQSLLLIDDARGIIYDCRMFIRHSTGVNKK
jgi:hypothetical protein